MHNDILVYNGISMQYHKKIILSCSAANTKNVLHSQSPTCNTQSARDLNYDAAFMQGTDVFTIIFTLV